jgi:ribonucleoside-diphosphate reductase beta chain
MGYQAINWNALEDEFSLPFLQQNIAQFWIEDDVNVSGDLNNWATLAPAQQELYRKVLAGLTLLDTMQGGDGMPLIARHVPNRQARTVLSFMGMMEEIHAKSYSRIFSTLCTKAEIEELFTWVEQQPVLQRKVELILPYYRNITDDESLYMAMVASVYLESFLFYSGFYYPLLLAGGGLMKNSGEIINLIIRDESIHGVYVGLLAQELYRNFHAETQQKLKAQTNQLLQQLMEVEEAYTSELYAELGLAEDVQRFLRYNANKALMNLGLDPIYEDTHYNPVVLAGLDTETKTHDFFSNKGNSYVKALNVEELRDEDFIFA